MEMYSLHEREENYGMNIFLSWASPPFNPQIEISGHPFQNFGIGTLRTNREGELSIHKPFAILTEDVNDLFLYLLGFPPPFLVFFGGGRQEWF